MFELLATILITLEMIAARAAWRQKHRVTRFGSLAAGCYGISERVGVGHRHDITEVIDNLCVVFSHGHNCLHLILDERKYLAVVIAFVLSAED